MGDVATLHGLEFLPMSTVCKLCKLCPAIKNSHVISALVFRAIKSDSPTGFFRNPHDPKRRFQDGDKFALLCADCEQRFGDAERDFSNNVFSAFHHHDQDQFKYGPWLHYFMTSIAWRTLILDLPGLEADAANPRATVLELKAAAETMRCYLLGATNLADSIRNHAVAWTKAGSASSSLAVIGPNVAIRRSVFGYSILDRSHGYSGILHNLAGFMCFLVVKGKPSDIWRGTKVKPEGGEIKSPQRASSWLIGELLSCVEENARKTISFSPAQERKVRNAIKSNPSARGLRFRELDKHISVDES